MSQRLEEFVKAGELPGVYKADDALRLRPPDFLASCDLPAVFVSFLENRSVSGSVPSDSTVSAISAAHVLHFQEAPICAFYRRRSSIAFRLLINQPASLDIVPVGSSVRDRSPVVSEKLYEMPLFRSYIFSRKISIRFIRASSTFGD
jgi:hypothetical protein